MIGFKSRPLSNLNSLPKVSVIYRVINAHGKVLYVGQTKNLNQRWRNGHKALKKALALGMDSTKVFLVWRRCPKYLLNRVESCEIAFFDPPWNIKLGTIV